MSTVIWADTSSGSRYRIDVEAMTWERLAHDGRSNRLRTESGSMLVVPEVAVGDSITLVCPPVLISGQRLVITTPVIAVYETEPEDPPVPAPGWWD